MLACVSNHGKLYKNIRYKHKLITAGIAQLQASQTEDCLFDHYIVTFFTCTLCTWFYDSVIHGTNWLASIETAKFMSLLVLKYGIWIVMGTKGTRTTVIETCLLIEMKIEVHFYLKVYTDGFEKIKEIKS